MRLLYLASVEGEALVEAVLAQLLAQRQAVSEQAVKLQLGKATALAEVVAVVVPETVMTQGHLIHDWRDARLFAAAAGALWFWWRRGILGTIVCGTVVLLALRLTLGW